MIDQGPHIVDEPPLIGIFLQYQSQYGGFKIFGKKIALDEREGRNFSFEFI